MFLPFREHVLQKQVNSLCGTIVSASVSEFDDFFSRERRDLKVYASSMK
jgi:hypothetical protein